MSRIRPCRNGEEVSLARRLFKKFMNDSESFMTSGEGFESAAAEIFLATPRASCGETHSDVFNPKLSNASLYFTAENSPQANTFSMLNNLHSSES